MKILKQIKTGTANYYELEKTENLKEISKEVEVGTKFTIVGKSNRAHRYFVNVKKTKKGNFKVIDSSVDSEGKVFKNLKELMEKIPPASTAVPALDQ